MIGVLALQGAFSKHLQCLKLLKAPCMEVKTLEQLEACDALILPGGESTAHQKLMGSEFWEALKIFAHTKPIMGTCCGLILLSKSVYKDSMRTLEALDVTVSRNAFGPQIYSFTTELETTFLKEGQKMKGCFIRAPQIVEIAPSVKVLARYENQPVIVQQGLVVAATFHPEVLLDVSLHRYFLEQLSLQSLVDCHRLG